MSKETNPSARQVLTSFFDDGSFIETDAYLKGEEAAEAITGYGTVDGVSVYAFAQDADVAGGAMSTIQSRKLSKLYTMALKTGAPLVGFYDSVGGKLTQGCDLLSAYGDILRKSTKLSGVVPRISVVLGNCLGAGALTAVSSDFVIVTESARLSVDVLASDADADTNRKNGTAQFVVPDTAAAIAKARDILSYLPSNNLDAAPAFESVGPYDAPDKFPKLIADADSLLCVSDGYGDRCVCTAFARVDGRTVGFVVTKGTAICHKGAKKIYRFVRFCDAFSIPVLTLVDTDGFRELSDASGVIAAYTDATTAKIAVIYGKAVGAAYIALAGSSSGSDAVFATADAIVSPVEPVAAAYLLDGAIADLPADRQRAAADSFVRANLTAVSAAESGAIDDIVDQTTVRARVIAALDVLSTKRTASIPKKHTTLL